MDPQTEQIKELIRQNIALSQENNRLIHAMRRSQRWSTIIRILWWLVVFGLSGAAYYYYLQPYMQQLIHVYQNLQQQGVQAQSFGQQISGFFANFAPHASSTPTTTP